jgi:hypothetical protein
MGSVGLGNNALLGAFSNKIFREGLDLTRSQIRENLGVFVADPTATFLQGMLVMRNSAGLVVPSNGLDVLGVAKWNHATSLLAVEVDEAIVLTGTNPSSLKRGNVSNLRVASAPAGGGTVYTVGTDYTFSGPNGTVTRVAAGGITSGSTVYVTYTFVIPTQDLYQTQGVNFWNNLDEVSQADGRVTVITDSELLFTTQYDTSRVYTLTGATSNLYASTAAGKEGLFTTDPAGGAKFVGRVMQVPTASDPYLGVRLFKSAIAA